MPSGASTRTLSDDRRADHDDAAAHHRRRGDLEFARPQQRLADLDLHLAVVAEIGAGSAGPRVERDHAGVVGAHEDAAAAGRALGRLIVDPIGDAAAVVAIGRALAGADLRIVAPFLRTRAGIERDHLVERRTEDQAVLDEQRRRLELGALHHRRRAACEIAGAKFPGADEIADIGGRDLVERRETHAAAIAAPMFPGSRRACSKRNEGQQTGEASHAIDPSGGDPATSQACPAARRSRDRIFPWARGCA